MLYGDLSKPTPLCIPKCVDMWGIKERAASNSKVYYSKFSKEIEPTEGCVCVCFKSIYYKELTHEIMEDEKYQHLWLASWRQETRW
jgi:hypothetical protein